MTVNMDEFRIRKEVKNHSNARTVCAGFNDDKLPSSCLNDFFHELLKCLFKSSPLLWGGFEEVDVFLVLWGTIRKHQRRIKR